MIARSALFRSLAALLLLACISGVTHSSGISFIRLNIDLTDKEDAANNATWSDPEKNTVTADGLGWDGEASSSRDGWIRTKPFTIAASWRPPVALSMSVSVYPAPKEIVMNNGQRHTPMGGRIFVRYSPDLMNWSSWHALQEAPPRPNSDPNKPGQRYQLTIAVPWLERTEYDQRLAEYARLDVPWRSDEDAAVRWLVQRDPDFFSRHIPFIAYVEFLVETSFYGGRRLQAFNAQMSVVVSGMHYPPKDMNDPNYKSWGRTWDYRASGTRDSRKP